MRLLALYLRTRRAGYAVLGLVAIALIGGIGAEWLLEVPRLGGPSGYALIPAILLMPLLSASVIGASLDSPIGELEQTVSRSLPRLRTMHLLLLGLVASVGVLVVAQGWDHPDPEAMLARNLAGFLGMTLLSAWLIGGRLAWIPPLAYAMLSLLRGHGSDGEIATWAWSVQPADVDSAVYWVLGLFVAGIVLAVWKGPRVSAGD